VKRENNEVGPTNVLALGSEPPTARSGRRGGAIVAWRCERVDPTGSILAIDLETKFLAALAYPKLEVRCLDITADDLSGPPST
jgi:hypothetical protein